VNYKSKEKIHSGFFLEALSLWGKIIDALYKELKLKHDDARKIYVTVHSLGGAMAVVVAGFVQRHTPVDGRLDSLITFGQPRVVIKSLMIQLNVTGNVSLITMM